MTSVWPYPQPKAGTSDLGEQPKEFERLWRAFMTARATLGLVLAIFQGGVLMLMSQPSIAPLTVCLIYFVAALTVRLKESPQQLRRTFDAQWLRTVGVDVLVFATMQTLQGVAIDYTPLFALPVLMVSVLGSMMLAMATAASITLLLFVNALWIFVRPGSDISANFLQAALTGTGFFAISFVASQLATRLASVELRAQRSQLAATEQRQVNELVIRTLTDGVLVVDVHGKVRSANPAAHLMLDNPTQNTELNLSQRAGCHALMAIIDSSFANRDPQQADIIIDRHGHSPRRLRVRTQLTGSPQHDALGLCVVFMQDQREMQARIRSEKLASMGRMSAAVAHEIRNPLAAITQANALLTEELSDPVQQRLAQMVGQNALRLENIVKDVLHLAQGGMPGPDESTQALDLRESTTRICRDWHMQHAASANIALDLPQETPVVRFDAEHLRRVLINLLDNANRYASHLPGSIQVSADVTDAANPDGQVTLRVWSDGPVLDASVEQHLFEPFFSSESRSSGLGLYICRELCESHGASISYDRSERWMTDQHVSGNEFSVTFKFASAPPTTP